MLSLNNRAALNRPADSLFSPDELAAPETGAIFPMAIRAKDNALINFGFCFVHIAADDDLLSVILLIGSANVVEIQSGNGTGVSATLTAAAHDAIEVGRQSAIPVISIGPLSGMVSFFLEAISASMMIAEHIRLVDGKPIERQEFSVTIAPVKAVFELSVAFVDHLLTVLDPACHLTSDLSGQTGPCYNSSHPIRLFLVGGVGQRLVGVSAPAGRVCFVGRNYPAWEVGVSAAQPKNYSIIIPQITPQIERACYNE